MPPCELSPARPLTQEDLARRYPGSFMLARLALRQYAERLGGLAPEAVLAYLHVCLCEGISAGQLRREFRSEAYEQALRSLLDRSVLERARAMFPLRLLRIAIRLAARLDHIDRRQLEQANTFLLVS